MSRRRRIDEHCVSVSAETHHRIGLSHHWVSPEIRKRSARLVEKADRPPELVVFSR